MDLVDASLWKRLAGHRVFLTGGTGFVGKWLLATLLEADRVFGLACAATVLSRNPEAFRAQVPHLANAPSVHLLQGDVCDFASPAGEFGFVIHAATDVVASHTPLDIFDTCVRGTRRVLDFALQAGTTDLLLVSSGAVYGPQPVDLDAIPEGHAGAPNPLSPASAYGEGKRVSEWLVGAYAAEHPLRVRVARCFAFVGPYLSLDKHFAIGNFLRDAMAQRPIVIRGDGTPYRTYLHAADMAGWLWKILLSGTPGAAYNVGGAEAVSIGELAQRVTDLLGSPAPVNILKTPVAGQPPQRYVPSVAKAASELGLDTPLALDESIRRTAQWHQRTTPHT